MKKQLCLILTMSLIAASLSACSKDKAEESIKRIDASNAAESKDPTERKYEDTSKEPVTAPDRNSTANTTGENTPEGSETTVTDRDPSIYGIWLSGDGSNLTLFNSSNGVKFIMYDASSDNYISGDAATDETSYIELKYWEPVEETPAEPEPLPEDGEQPAALETEPEAQYETVRYSIDKNEFNQETSTMLLTITGNGKTLEMSMQITSDTPDYSTEDNELAKDMIDDSSHEEKKEETAAETTVE